MMKKLLAIILTCLMTLPLGMACAEITQFRRNGLRSNPHSCWRWAKG